MYPLYPLGNRSNAVYHGDDTGRLESLLFSLVPSASILRAALDQDRALDPELYRVRNNL